MSEVQTADVNTQTVQIGIDTTISEDDEEEDEEEEEEEDGIILSSMPPDDMQIVSGTELLEDDSGLPGGASIVLLPDSEDASDAYQTADGVLLACPSGAALPLEVDPHVLLPVDGATSSHADVAAPSLMLSADGDGVCAVVSSIEAPAATDGDPVVADVTMLSSQTQEGFLTGATLNGHQLIFLCADGTVASIQHAVGEAAEPVAKRFKVDDTTYLLTMPEGYVEATTKGAQVIVNESSAACERVQPNDVTQAWFTTRDDKAALQNNGQTWKQGQWCKDEIQLLETNIDNYLKLNQIAEVKDIVFDMSKDERKDFYRTVARGLNRPLFSVYRRVIRMYDQKNHVGKYSPDEINKLKELRCRHGTDWASIGAALGRSASSVKDRCRLMKDTCNSGKWLPEEEKRLADAVYALSNVHPGENITSGLSWAAVAERVSTRSEKQCRTKWLNYLNWKQLGGSEWTRDDDVQLVEKISESRVTDETQIDWVQLSKDWTSVRSPQWLRGKWWSLKRYISGYQTLSFPEVVDCVRNMNHHLHGQKPTGLPSTTTLKTSKMEFPSQHINVIAPGIISIPVVSTESSLLGSAGVEGGPYEAYEVLQGYEGEPQPLPGGAFVISQPHGNSSMLSFTAPAASASDRIIVHTLPVVQMSASPDISVNINAHHMMVSDSGSQQTISDDIHDSDSIQLEEHISQSDDELHSLSQAEDLSCGIGHDSLDGVGQLHHENVAVERVEIHEASEAGAISVSSSALSSVTTTQADLIHMSSFSDPMMMSDSSDLMCSPSDIEVGKDAAQEADSLDPHD